MDVSPIKLVMCILPVLDATLSRRKWPLDKYSRPKVLAILLEIVPFPDPGGPMIAARNSLAILVETRLQSLDCPTLAAGVFSVCFVFFISNFSFRHARYKKVYPGLDMRLQTIGNVFSVVRFRDYPRETKTPSPTFFLKLYHGYTLICVFKDRLSSANQ